MASSAEVMGHPLSRRAELPNTEKIRQLNDAFRMTFKGGRVHVTNGLAGRPDIVEILRAVRTYDDFGPDNDPYGEHDFGAFKASNGDLIFFRIDYHASDLQMGSEDPSDESITCRVLTVMRADEY
jgi:hypothetical protein